MVAVMGLSGSQNGWKTNRRKGVYPPLLTRTHNVYVHAKSDSFGKHFGTNLEQPP